MRYRQFGRGDQGPTAARAIAQIMIGHPNNSGLQMDQVKQLYIPAFFINDCTSGRTTAQCCRWKAGFPSRKTPISASPTSRTARSASGRGRITQGHVFQHEWNVDASGI